MLALMSKDDRVLSGPPVGAIWNRYRPDARGEQRSAILPYSFTTMRTATGFLHGLANNGIRVPEDISVIGYDDMPYAAVFNPGLTTIRLPRRPMGATGVPQTCRGSGRRTRCTRPGDHRAKSHCPSEHCFGQKINPLSISSRGRQGAVMSAMFEELDYAPTPIGAISLRRRHILALKTDVFEILLGEEHLIVEPFHCIRSRIGRNGARCFAWRLS